MMDGIPGQALAGDDTWEVAGRRLVVEVLEIA